MFIESPQGQTWNTPPQLTDLNRVRLSADISVVSNQRDQRAT